MKTKITLIDGTIILTNKSLDSVTPIGFDAILRGITTYKLHNVVVISDNDIINYDWIVIELKDIIKFSNIKSNKDETKL